MIYKYSINRILLTEYADKSCRNEQSHAYLMRNVCRTRIDVPSNGRKGKTAEICERAAWVGVEKLKLMARERFSSTSAVVDAMSLLKRDEKDTREAPRYTGERRCEGKIEGERDARRSR